MSKNEFNAEKENAIFAKKLRILFDERKVTQQTLVDYIEAETGKSPTRQTVSMWLHGNSPDIKTIPIIAKFFGVTTDYLLTDTEVRTTDTDLSAICKFTGLSEKTIAHLRTLKDYADGISIKPFQAEEIRKCIQWLDEELKDITDSEKIKAYEDWAESDIMDYKERSVNEAKHELRALNALLSFDDFPEFLHTLNIFLYTDFSDKILNAYVEPLSGNHSPEFSISAKILEEAALSELQNYIRELKSTTDYKLDEISLCQSESR